MTKQLPRGIRNHNPGNIEYHKETGWQGLDSPPSDGRFCRFKSPTYGIRAMARVLITYYDKYGCTSVYKVIQRWAPPFENDTSAYASAVAEACGVEVMTTINLHEYDVLRPMVEAIIRHENGQQPYTPAQIDKALVLAGVEPEKKPLAKSRTMVGSSVAITAGTAAQAIQEAQDKVQPLIGYADSLKWVFLALALGGIGLTMWARFDDWRKGLR